VGPREHKKKMTNKSAATRYARAVLDVAIKEKADLEQIERELTEFNALLDAQPLLKKVLLNPAVPVPRKRAAMVALLEQMSVTPIVSKLFVLLAERDRLILLPDLLAAYRDRLADHRNVVRAEVTTATPLTPERTQQIQKSLAQVTGRTVMLQTRVDPTIVGGLVAKVGSVVYDASVTRQLEKLKQRLVESV
jgi:F-type H+-transporting ATPase subunit delta